jgi:hypothetical protein
MRKFTRNPHPEVVVWKQADRTIDRLAETPAERGDPGLAFDAAVTVTAGP